MALSDHKIPILTGINDVPSTTGQPNHPNASLLCKQYNDLIDNELQGIPPKINDAQGEFSDMYLWVDSVNGDDTADGIDNPVRTIARLHEKIRELKAFNYLSIYISGSFTNPDFDFSGYPLTSVYSWLDYSFLCFIDIIGYDNGDGAEIIIDNQWSYYNYYSPVVGDEYTVKQFIRTPPNWWVGISGLTLKFTAKAVCFFHEQNVVLSSNVLDVSQRTVSIPVFIFYGGRAKVRNLTLDITGLPVSPSRIFMFNHVVVEFDCATYGGALRLTGMAYLQGSTLIIRVLPTITAPSKWLFSLIDWSIVYYDSNFAVSRADNAKIQNRASGGAVSAPLIPFNSALTEILIA